MLVGRDVPASAGLRVAMNVGYKDQGAGTITEVISNSAGRKLMGKTDHTGPGPTAPGFFGPRGRTQSPPCICRTKLGRSVHSLIFAGIAPVPPRWGTRINDVRSLNLPALRSSALLQNFQPNQAWWENISVPFYSPCLHPRGTQVGSSGVLEPESPPDRFSRC